LRLEPAPIQQVLVLQIQVRVAGWRRQAEGTETAQGLLFLGDDESLVLNAFQQPDDSTTLSLELSFDDHEGPHVTREHLVRRFSSHESFALQVRVWNGEAFVAESSRVDIGQQVRDLVARLK